MDKRKEFVKKKTTFARGRGVPLVREDEEDQEGTSARASSAALDLSALFSSSESESESELDTPTPGPSSMASSSYTLDESVNLQHVNLRGRLQDKEVYTQGGKKYRNPSDKLKQKAVDHNFRAPIMQRPTDKATANANDEWSEEKLMSYKSQARDSSSDEEAEPENLTGLKGRLVDDEKWTKCPYFKGHVFISKKAAGHLNTCQGNYAKMRAQLNLPMDIVVCPFNASHHVRAKKLAAHEKTCSSLFTAYSYLQHYIERQRFSVKKKEAAAAEEKKKAAAASEAQGQQDAENLKKPEKK